MNTVARKWVGIGLITVIGLIGAVGLFAAFSGGAKVEVHTERVSTRDLASVVTASGVIQPKRKVDISSDISGRVVEVTVEDGQYVEKGDLLLRIDPTKYRAAVQRARAEVARARAEVSRAHATAQQTKNSKDRSVHLSERNEAMISKEELERVETEASVAAAVEEAAQHSVQRAVAALVEAEDDLRKTTIRAPRRGRVTRIDIEEGETAVVGTMNNPGSLLLTIADLGTMEASVRVDETDVMRIERGDVADVHVDALPGQTLTGRVTRIANSAIRSTTRDDGESVDYEVIVTLDDPPSGLRPDLSATAEIITDRRDGVVTVPIISVTVRDTAGKTAVGGDGVEGVFVVEDDGTARFSAVHVGITGDRYFEVTGGLDGGETVVAGPYSAVRSLQAGEALSVTSTDEPEAPEAQAAPTPSDATAAARTQQ